MGAVIHVLMWVATQVRSGWADIVLGERPDKSADEVHYELLKGLV